MNNRNDKLDQAIDALRNVPVPQGPSDDLIRQTLDRIAQTQPKTIPDPGIRRLYMKRFMKFAAAAVIVIGGSSLFLFSSAPNAIALAAVYNKVLQAQAFMYNMSMTMSGVGEMTGMPSTATTVSNASITISTEYGMKMENHMQIQNADGTQQNITQLAYMLPSDKIVVSIMPDQKTYQKIELTGQLLEETKKQNYDPRETIRRMMNCNYISLGQSEINGVRVQGFETTDPTYGGGIGDTKAVLWVDADTWLPVRSEASTTIGEKMKIEVVISDFQWNVSVDPAEFTYVIPDDYKDAGSMKMPEMTEEAALEGLRLYAKLFGQYPEKIDLASLVPEIVKKTKELLDDPKTEYAKEFVQKLKKGQGGDQQRQAAMQQVQQEITPISSLAMFHLKLNQQKQDPAYYGKTVTPGDANAVLFRWKASDTTCKVIMGDLSITEMSADQLHEIEPAPDQPSVK